MGQAVGSSLVLAIGVAICPLPIIAIVLLLTTPRARSNGSAFVAGWFLGLGAVGATVLVLAGSADASESGGPATWVDWVKVVLGVLLLAVAVREFCSRPRDGVAPPMPRWMARVDGATPPTSMGLGAGLAALNPKNLLLAVAGATAIAQTGIPGAQQAVAYLVFAVLGSTGVLTPVVIYLAMGARAAAILGRLKVWMGQNNAVIMSVLCVVIGAKLLGDALAAFWH